jgi:hypothetical protein
MTAASVTTTSAVAAAAGADDSGPTDAARVNRTIPMARPWQAAA